MAKKTVSERIILGVDPGTNVTGYGLIRVSGNSMSLITYGVIDLKKIKDDHGLKLRRIFERILSIVDEFHPDELAIEAPFFGKNVQSMLKLGRAQGVAMAACLYRDIPMTEYSPRKVKMAVTGKGTASKEQVMVMLEKLLNFNYDHKLMDASDGLALAVCHFLQKRVSIPAAPKKTTLPSGKGGGKKTSWETFLNQHPDRVKK
jgi:crossover junction endodeoxyribonuclease RuvC